MGQPVKILLQNRLVSGGQVLGSLKAGRARPESRRSMPPRNLGLTQVYSRVDQLTGPKKLAVAGTAVLSSNSATGLSFVPGKQFRRQVVGEGNGVLVREAGDCWNAENRGRGEGRVAMRRQACPPRCTTCPPSADRRVPGRADVRAPRRSPWGGTQGLHGGEASPGGGTPREPARPASQGPVHDRGTREPISPFKGQED